MQDQRLQAIREKEAVIATYNADTLTQSPEIVDSVYSAHAHTHISMGDTSTFVDKLIHWTRNNKGSVVGAIVGPYCYGKTSTAVHLWRQCENDRVIAVPPFAWFHLNHIIDATYAWVNYRLGQIAPDHQRDLAAIYQRFRQQSLDTLARERGLSVDALEGLLRDGLLKLETKPADVVRFLAEVSLILHEIDREGPVVFTDELQVTLSEYATRDQFMEDLFGLLNELHQRQGSFGLVLSMPTATEALIADVRGDIIHRMQTFKFYLRPEALYGRTFASELWLKFAHLLGFTNIMSDVLPADSLKSIGQISARLDLGAGPRTVIDAFRRAVKYYDESQTAYTPIDLIDDYLAGNVAFDQSGKIAYAVREAVSAAPVAGDNDKEAAVKLLAAFPEGCPEEIQHRYDVADVVVELPAVYRREYLYDFAEGPSLRKLAATEVKADPVFLKLTKEFVGRYKEDARHLNLAVTALKNAILRNLVFTERRGTSLVGWKWESENVLNGAFSERYPDRSLFLKVTHDPAALNTAHKVDEFGIWIHVDDQLDGQDPGEARRVGGTRKALLRLNAKFRSAKPLNVAYINDLGVPTSKVTPLFLLALYQHLEENRTAIPNEELVRTMKAFGDQLLSNAVLLLFNNELREHSDWQLTLIGHEMIKDIFNQMCEATYPSYATFITMRGWEGNVTLYHNALLNPRVTIGVAHGQQPLSGTKDEIVRMFGQTGTQPFINMQRTIPQLLEITNWAGRENGEVRLKLHPLEQAVLTALEASTDKAKLHGMSVGALAADTILDLARRQGYLQVELQHALKLLVGRRYVTFDQGLKKFVQLIESPEERRTLLNEKLDGIRETIKTLGAEIPDFNEDKYSSQVASVARKADKAQEIRELEPLYLEATRIRNDVDHWIEQAIQINYSSVTEMMRAAQHELQSVLAVETASASSSSMGQQSPWSRFLQLVRQELDEQARSATETGQELLQLGNRIIEKAKGAETPLDKLCTLFEGQVNLRQIATRFNGKRKEAAKYVQQFRDWEELPPLSISTRREVDNCANIYGMPEFQERLNLLEQRVEGHVTARNALGIAAGLRSDLQQLLSETQQWISGQSDLFSQAKALREQILSELSGRSVQLLASFDHYRPTDSHETLYVETRQHLQQLTRQLGGVLTRAKNDIAYLALILKGSPELAKLPKSERIDAEFSKLWDRLLTEALQDPDALRNWAVSFRRVSGQISTLLNELNAMLVKQPSTDTEQRVLNLLHDGRTVELGELVRALAKQRNNEGDDFSLEQLMSDIQSLFRKNHLVIKVEKRP